MTDDKAKHENIVEFAFQCEFCGAVAEGSMDPLSAERFIRFWNEQHVHKESGPKGQT